MGRSGPLEDTSTGGRGAAIQSEAYSPPRNGEDRMSARNRRNGTARRMSWLLVAGLTAGALLVPAASAVSANPPADLHCPAGGVKVEANDGTQDAINDLVLAAGTMFCVKAGPGNTGILMADGQTDLQGYSPDGKDVSYYVIYETPSEEPAKSRAKSPAKSLPRSRAKSLPRSRAKSLPRSRAKSLPRSPAKSLLKSPAKSLLRSRARSPARIRAKSPRATSTPRPERRPSRCRRPTPSPRPARSRRPDPVSRSSCWAWPGSSPGSCF